MIPLAKPDLGEAEIAAAIAVLRTGNFVQGEQVERFEAELAHYIGRRHAVVVSSGTAALHLAMVALGVGPGDEVVIPAFTFPATANAVELAGGTPVLCDVDPISCNIDPKQIAPLITRRTRAIMPVHEFGRPADMDRLGQIAQEHGVDLIEDAACAIGASWKGVRCGSFGRMACFSFHPRKVLTTGEGGAILLDDDDLADRLRLLRNHGIRRSGGMVDFVCAGYNYRLTEIQAAIGRVQLQRLHEMIADRRLKAGRYLDLLAGVRLTLPREESHVEVTYQTFHILLPENAHRDDAVASMLAKGIAVGPGASALPTLTHHCRFAGDRRFPGATRAASGGLALPLWHGLSETDLSHIAHSLREMLGGA